jgi:hypothetical protein
MTYGLARGWWNAIVLVAVLLLPASGFAQTSTLTDLRTLRTRLAPGSVVHVLETSGRTAAGRLETLNDDGLVLRAGTDMITISAGDIRRVAVPRHGKRNGAIIGACIGGAMGALAVRFAGGSSAARFFMPVLSAGFYGTMGLGIGALWPSERVVYRAPGQAPTGGPGPLPRRIGAAATITW